ncbi:MAG: carbohydrate kinase family protein [Patescibacteria group bacterium]
MSKPQVVVCGSIAIDRIMNFSGRYRDLIKPEKLHALSLSTLLEELEDSRGGTGANIACNLALLGENPALLGSVGKDAKEYIDDLAKLGVDTTGVHLSQLATASFNVITDSEDSQVGGFYQGAMGDSESLSFSSWQGKDALMVIAAHNPSAMNSQARECQQYGLKLVYDPGQQVSDPATDLGTGVAAAEVLIVNDYELGVLCEKLATSPEQLAKRIPILITTKGKDGSIIDGHSLPSPIKVSAAKPNAVVDPTGAGDAYRAGFLYGYLRQWDLTICGQLGAVVASFIIEQHGTQQHFTKQAVMDRYRDNFNQEVEL